MQTTTVGFRDGTPSFLNHLSRHQDDCNLWFYIVIVLGLEPVVISVMNVSHRLMDLNTWSPVGGAVWEGLRVMALLERLWQWRRALK